MRNDRQFIATYPIIPEAKVYIQEPDETYDKIKASWDFSDMFKSWNVENDKLSTKKMMVNKDNPIFNRYLNFKQYFIDIFNKIETYGLFKTEAYKQIDFKMTGYISYNSFLLILRKIRKELIR